MKLILRILYEYIRSKYIPDTQMNEEIISQFRVLPTDLDFNGHMTNNRYHTIMDYSALRLMGSHGILRVMFRKKWRPIVGCSLVSHRQSLQVFQQYRVKSKVIYCDALWTYISHIIESDGEIIAAANRKYALLGQGKLINSKKVFAELGADYKTRPAEIETVQSWVDAEKTVIKLSQEDKKAIKQTDRAASMTCKKQVAADLIDNQVAENNVTPCLYANLACAKNVGCGVENSVG